MPPRPGDGARRGMAGRAILVQIDVEIDGLRKNTM